MSSIQKQIKELVKEIDKIRLQGHSKIDEKNLIDEVEKKISSITGPRKITGSCNLK